MDRESVSAYLILYGLPLASLLAGVAAAVYWGRRWYAFAAATTLAAVVVSVGATIWYGSGCSDSSTCTGWIGGALEAIWILLAASLIAVATLAVLRRRHS